MKRREIFDIFSKSFRKRKGSDELGSLNKKSRVVVDFREKSSRLPALLSGAGFEVDFRKLSVGDYVIGDVVIERKEVRDFVGSIINKRIMRQLLDLSQVEKKFLFVEGNLDLSEEKFFGIRSNAIRGFILSVGLKYNIPIVFTKDFRESVKFMLILANKKDKDIDLDQFFVPLSSKGKGEGWILKAP